MENNDFLNITYRVNGGAEQTLLSVTDSFSSMDLEQCGIDGNTLEVIVDGATSVGTEEYNVTDIQIGIAETETPTGFRSNRPDITISNAARTIRSGEIDISGESNLCLSLTAEGLGNMENDDFLNITYQVNGGSEQTLLSVTDSFSSMDLEQCGIDGNTLEVIVNGATSVGTEEYNVTDIQISN